MNHQIKTKITKLSAGLALVFTMAVGVNGQEPTVDEGTAGGKTEAAAGSAQAGGAKVDLKGAGVGGGDGITGYRLKDYPINDLFQYLARLSGKQYFQNPALGSITISGQMMDGDPIKRMQEVAFQYGISLYEKGNTIYAMPASEIANMPVRQAEFKLRYLRADKARLREMLTPYLTKGVGVVEYEDKTNTLMVQDNEPALTRIRELLAGLDVPARQVTIQVRIFRVTMDSGRDVGISWAKSLGKDTGIDITGTAMWSLKEIFGVNTTEKIVNNITESLKQTGDALSPKNEIDNLFQTKSDYDRETVDEDTMKTDFALNQVALTATLRALYENADAEIETAPVIITEDNETAVFEHIDKIPIVTTDVQSGSGTQNASTDVRYQPDPEDPFDIGLKLTVKPTILPGNRIRLKITPSIGTITGYTKTANGDYPKVLLSSLDNIATVSNGYTLVFGGFTQYSNIKGGDKVPILGDIPGLSFFFSSTSNRKARTNLVFFVTATAIDAAKADVSTAESERIRRELIADPSVQYADDARVGSSAKPDLAKSLQNELVPFGEPKPRTNPLHPDTPGNQNLPRLVTPQEQTQESVLRALPAAPEATPRKKRPWENIIPPRASASSQ
jgi:type II secretory pathway component GspD/PulD (secretin)